MIEKGTVINLLESGLTVIGENVVLEKYNIKFGIIPIENHSWFGVKKIEGLFQELVALNDFGINAENNVFSYKHFKTPYQEWLTLSEEEKETKLEILLERVQVLEDNLLKMRQELNCYQDNY
jgi:hypothetical protein